MSHSEAQLAAAMAARAKIDRLLSSPTPFARDDGSVDPAVARALADDELPRHEYIERLWAALVAGRVLVSVAAHALPRRAGAPVTVLDAQVGAVPEHEVHTADAAQDAAALAVDLSDGRLALPVFTSIQAMRAWRDQVRPVPVTARRAAQVACEHAQQLWILDPATADLLLPRPAVIAAARGREWIPSWRNEPVQAELAAQLEAVEGVCGVAFAPGEGSELRVFVRIDSSGARTSVERSLRAAQAIMADPAWGELIDTVELCPLPA